MAAKFTIGQLRVALLVAIALTVLVTGGTYAVKARLAARSKPAPPAPIPPTVTQAAKGFSISKSEAGRVLFKAEARKAVDFRETGKSVLEEVEILTYGSTGNRADRITSRRCEYDSKTGHIYSQGEVEIELASLPGQLPLPASARTSGSPLWVKTSGLTFDQNTGVATTERDLLFRFQRGSGRARGAVYDSRQQTLWLKAEVEFTASGEDRDEKPAGEPVHVKAGELRYLQRELQIHVTRPELRRNNRVITADEATLYLDERHEMHNAVLMGNVHGIEQRPDGASEFRGDRVDLNLSPQQQVEFLFATGNVRVDSQGAGGRSESHAARLELDFSGPRGALRQSQWKGGVRMVFLPPDTKGQTRIITSEQIEMVMKPGGQEMDAARTLAPGRLELTGGSQPRRVVTADSFWMQFGPRNQLKLLRAQGKARTETEGKPPRVTTSDLLVAAFSADSHQLETMEQTGQFRYQEGERQARGDRAYHTAADGAILLTGSPGKDPEAWDSAGRVTARRIRLNEKTGEALAEQDVRATRFASQDGKPAVAGLLGNTLSENRPVHAAAERLRWDRDSNVSRYEGGPGGRARLWQGQDVLEAHAVEMERSARRLTATGQVTTVLVEEGKDPVRINAERLVYTDADRRAHYERNVVLLSRDVTLRSAALDGFLRPSEENKENQSRLERALALGSVRVNQPPRPAEAAHPAVPARRAEAERAEYFPDQEKILLSGGNPSVYDELRGFTRGRELTYFIGDDRLFVVGGDNERALSEHRVTRRP